MPSRLKDDADRHNEIPDIPAAAGLIGVDSSRHAQQPGDVHEIECQVKADQEQPEVPACPRVSLNIFPVIFGNQ